MSDETKNPGKRSQEKIENLTTSDLLVAIMNRISNDIGDEALVRVLALLDEIAVEQSEKD